MVQVDVAFHSLNVEVEDFILAFVVACHPFVASDRSADVITAAAESVVAAIWAGVAEFFSKRLSTYRAGECIDCGEKGLIKSFLGGTGLDLGGGGVQGRINKFLVVAGGSRIGC